MKKMMDLAKAGALAFGLFFAMASCNNNSNPDQNATDENATSTPAGASAATAEADKPALTDPQIASIAVTANQIDIDYAKVAESKATNPKVKEFAQTMAKDHQSVIDQAVALAKKLGVTPEDNPTTQSLLDGEKAVMEKFNSLTGADFDKAYIDNEVEYHKAAIGVVENTLIPGSTNQELKSLLQTALPLFKTHLEHAQMVQSEVNK